MSYIIKNTAALINTKITDAARKKISQGKFDISYFQVGDSEVCYDCINNMNLNDSFVLMPQDNSQNLSPVPEKNRMNIKYPLFLDSTSGATYGVPFDASYIDNVYNSAAPRGFFSGNSVSGFTLLTTSAYTINPNFVVDNTTLTSGTILTLSATSINPSVSGTANVGSIITLFTQNSIQPLSGNSPMFTFVVVGITGDTSTGSTITVQVDRNLPDFTSLGYSGNSSVIFYPSSMTELYDSYTPEPYWNTDAFNFESNCDISQADVKVWNMNSPWTESPAGIFNTTYQDYNFYASSGYCGSKEYFGYNESGGQTDTDRVYYHNSFSEEIIVPPASGFTSLDLFEVHYIKSKKDIQFNSPGLRYYHLWDTHANVNGYPNRVGKVFPDYKMIIFDDEEIVATLNSKSNRSWTLPAPKLGLVTPNTFNGVLGGTTGLLSGSSETLFLTYRLNSSAFTNSLHCNYYTTISGNDQSLLPGPSDIIIRFGNEFPFLTSTFGTSPSGFSANDITILAQKVPSGTSRPDTTQWREINISDQYSATTSGGYLTLNSLTGVTYQITKNMYDTAPIYQLTNYLDIPVLNQTGVTFNFGGDYYFFGNIQTDIQATIYVMNFLCNLGQTQFFDSSNPTWNGTTSPYITEVGLYNADKELMVISKIQSPQKRQGIQQYPIKLDF